MSLKVFYEAIKSIFLEKRSLPISSQKEIFVDHFIVFDAQEQSFENIVAVTDVELKVIGYDRLNEKFKDDLNLNIFGRKTIEQVCIDKDIRISKMLKLDARGRYLWFMEEYPEIIKYAPLKYVASYLGMNPETLSRMRKEISS